MGDKGIQIGIGLRHSHYADILNTPANLDFVEVHAENFFMQGGAAIALLEQVKERFPVSIHSTSGGLGSAAGIPDEYLQRLAHLVAGVNPILVSDHACFAWGKVQGMRVHGGDLLPIPFNQESLDVMCRNVNLVQEKLGRKLLVENLSAYFDPEGSTMAETEYLLSLTKTTGCQLLLDLNNLAVNARNQKVRDPLKFIRDYVDRLDASIIGEIHLAGCTPVPEQQIMVDDHSRPVAETVWQAYAYAIERFGPVPTLIEWDTDLPEFDVLLGEAEKARKVAEASLAA